MNTKSRIIEGLYAFVAQRPGMDPRDYDTYASYRSLSRDVTRDRHIAERLIGAIAWRASITAEDIVDASRRAYSGRLEITQGYRVNGEGFVTSIDAAQERARGYLPLIVTIESAIKIDYCTGQCWPTEYRKAVCAVCAQCLWSYWRANGYETGDAIRKQARKELGATITRRFFR